MQLQKQISTQTLITRSAPADEMLEGVVVSGSWDAAEGICQVLVGDTVPYESPFFADGNNVLMPICRIINPAIGDQYAPVGGERAMIWKAQCGFVAWVYHGPDDTSPVPAGERWIQHRSALNYEAVNFDSAVRLTNDGPTSGDKLGGAYTGGTGALTQSQTKSGARHTINDTAQTIETATPPTTANPDGLIGLFDNVAQQIIHSASGLTSPTSGVKTIVDGAGNAISHVVPGGGTVALGQIASSLTNAKYAAYNKNTVTSLATNLQETMGNLAQQMAKAAVAAGVTNAAAWLAGIQAGLPNLSFVNIGSSVAGITVPDGSPIVRIADGT